MSIRSLLGGIVAGDAPPVPYVSRWRNALGTAQQSGSRGREAQLALYADSGTLYGVVSKLASMTSLVNWRLYRSAASGLDADRVEVPRHAALMVLNRPNQFMTRQELVEAGQQHLDLAGECWWVIVRVGSVPFELWPVRPDRMRPVESNTDFIAGYIYRSPDGEEVPLKREDVIMVRTPSPLDIYRGMSPLPALDSDLDNDRAQGQWSAAFFQNNANPGGVITVDRRMQEDEWEEMTTRWNAQHRGISNAGRVAVLEQATFAPISYTQRDMQFVESRNFTKQAILDAYGFPKFGLGDVDDVNRASAEASMALMAQTLGVPRLERLKGALNNDFLPQFGTTGKGLEFDYDSPVPPDQELDNATLTAKATAVVALVQVGFDPDEACDTVGLPRMVWTERGPEVIHAPSRTGQTPSGDPQLA
jgi:HK97 family phage portal protein